MEEKKHIHKDGDHCHDEHCHDEHCHDEHCHDEHCHDGSCACCSGEEEINKGEFLFKIITGIAFFAIGYILEKFTKAPEYTYLVCFGISYLVVGFSIIREAIEGIIHGNIFNENFLMAVASLGAFGIKEYSEGCAVMILFTIGEFLQGMAVGKSKRSIANMLEMKSLFVHVEDGDGIKDIAPEEVKIGDVFVVNPGEKIDLDGVVVSGNAEVDMAALTGESIPVSIGAGDKVLAGSVNADGLLKIKAEKEYSDSTVSKILSLIENANDSKSHAEQFITRFAKIYTPIVCLIALLIIVVPPLFFNGEWSEWIYRGLSALVVSCPCALVISIPLGFFGGLGACSKEGILIKGSNYLEMLTKCDVGVFDKTGTITSGKFEYVKCECYHCHCKDKIEHRELLGLIAACERYSTHPLAKSVTLAFGPYADGIEVTDAKNFAGMGAMAVIDGEKYYAGNEKMMREVGVEFKETSIIGTPIYLCSEDEFLGDIVFADVIKQDSKDAISALHKDGVSKCVMLTGDKDVIASDIAKKAGIDEYHSKLLPDEKVAKVKELKNGGESLVLFTGDGINDAPVLAEADLGIAMGGIGSDAAIEASDMVIMSDSLSKIAIARKIAKKTMRIVHENIVFSLGVKILIIIGCAIGIFNENAMWLAVFGDVGVCLIAVANSLRTLHYRKHLK